MFRIGFGYDVHRLVEGKAFWLGGIEILHSKGALAHSDGDVLIHAVCDSLLGAAGLRDIGYYFPDTSLEFKDIDSKLLLKKVIDLIFKQGYTIVNIDSTICLQKPKISDYISKMKQVLAEVMAVSPENVSIKAKTSENLGFVGREEGVTAYAVALLQKSD